MLGTGQKEVGAEKRVEHRMSERGRGGGVAYLSFNCFIFLAILTKHEFPERLDPRVMLTYGVINTISLGSQASYFSI